MGGEVERWGKGGRLECVGSDGEAKSDSTSHAAKASLLGGNHKKRSYHEMVLMQRNIVLPRISPSRANNIHQYVASDR